MPWTCKKGTIILTMIALVILIKRVTFFFFLFCQGLKYIVLKEPLLFNSKKESLSAVFFYNDFAKFLYKVPNFKIFFDKNAFTMNRLLG